MRKLAPARVSYRDDFFILYRVYIMTRSFHNSLFEGTFHVNKIHVRFQIANITHALPIPVYRQTDFTPKRVVVSRLHDTVVRFRTGVKFSSRYNNRGGSRWGDSRRHDILWRYHANKCRAMRGNWSELTPARKSPRCHVNSPRKYFMKGSVSIMKKVLDLYSCCLCSTKRHLNNKEEKIPKAYRENQNQWLLSNFFS